jgi:pimeloyl-ACP methyl ester carboxylesterase
MPTIVLVHGAYHGAWCFEPLLPELASRGIGAVTVELPLTTLEEDAEAVSAALDASDGKVTLLGHSYGGSPVTVAGVHPTVERLVYLAALAPGAGDPPAGTGVGIGQPLLDALRPAGDGRTAVDPDVAVEVFYPDADPEAGRTMAAKLRPGATGGPADRIGTPAWQERPTHYIVCADDPIVLPDWQRRRAAEIGATVHELPGDHSPFLARPAELAQLLVEVVD